jgi:prepilin-type N-terminal cleavage/methylation domain-containing protein
VLALQRFKKVHSSQDGFSLIEVLLAAVIFAFLVAGLIGAIIYGRSATASAGDRVRALQIADEGIQAVKNIRDASYANLVDSTGGTVGDTAIESGSDSNVNGTSSQKVTTGVAGGVVNSVSVYIGTVDATNKHIQAAIYADSSGTPGTLLGASAAQIASANSWNTLPMTGVTVSPSTNYWIALSEDGATQFADSASGGTAAYHVTSGYPAPNPFAANATATSDKQSFYMSLAGTYGLTKASNQWAFSGASDISGIYTRQVTITTTGSNRKVISSTVTWPQASGTIGTVTVTDQLTNWSANIKQWSNAILAGSTAITGAHPALKVRTQGNYAYTVVSVAGAANFVVTNISNPAAPTIVSAITLPSSEVPTNIFVSGTKAYVTCTHATAELVILDIINPAAPTQVGSYTPTGTADGKAIFVSGTTAYFGRTSNSGVAELSILNVSNPAAPTVIGSYGPNVTIFQVFVSGNYAYLATSATNKGLIVVNITNPAAPVLASAFQLPNVLGGATVTGFGSTVLVGSAAVLYAINVATPTAPSVTGTFTAASTINDADVDITNKYAFVANIGSTGFQVVNIANLAAMTLAKAVTTTSGINGVSYDTSLDVVAGASSSTTLEAAVFTRN